MRILGKQVETIQELDEFIKDNHPKFSFSEILNLFQLRVLLEILNEIKSK